MTHSRRTGPFATDRTCRRHRCCCRHRSCCLRTAHFRRLLMIRRAFQCIVSINTVRLTLTRHCAAATEFCKILERMDIFEFRRSDLANTFPHREAQFARCGQWRQRNLHAFLRGRHRQHFRKERPPASPSQHKRGEKAPFPLLGNGNNNGTDALPMFVIPTEMTSMTFQKPDQR